VSHEYAQRILDPGNAGFASSRRQTTSCHCHAEASRACTSSLSFVVSAHVPRHSADGFVIDYMIRCENKPAESRIVSGNKAFCIAASTTLFQPIFPLSSAGIRAQTQLNDDSLCQRQIRRYARQRIASIHDDVTADEADG
jgi:hypothetical protein